MKRYRATMYYWHVGRTLKNPINIHSSFLLLLFLSNENTVK